MATVGGEFTSEEVALLLTLILLSTCNIDRFACVGIDTRIEHHRRESHRRRCEVLHLLEGEVQIAQDLIRERHHIALGTAWVRRDKVWDELVVEPLPATDLLEATVHLLEEGERRLAHKLQYTILSMLGSNFEATRSVVLDHGIEVVRFVEEVVADATADEGSLHTLGLTNLAVEFQEACMVVVHIGAELGVETRRTLAPLTQCLVTASHTIHIGRGGSHVR